MTMLHPVSIAIADNFHPLAHTPATSLVEYLPLGCTANCLLLGGGDPRKILYTLHSEMATGNQLTFNLF